MREIKRIRRLRDARTRGIPRREVQVVTACTHTHLRKRCARLSLLLVGKVRKYAFGAHGYIGARGKHDNDGSTREGGKPGLYICVLKGIPEYILHMLYCRLIFNSIPWLALGLQERTFFEPRSHSLLRFFERS